MLPAAEAILRKPPAWNPTDGSIDMYYWYYASYALFQVGGRQWDAWSRGMKNAVLRSQHRDGNPNLAGSWDPAGVWGSDGGRVYATAMMVLCLQAYWRYTQVLGGR